jgi:hypothetical protein
VPVGTCKNSFGAGFGGVVIVCLRMRTCFGCRTLIEQKSRMPHIQGVTGEEHQEKVKYFFLFF